MGALASTLPLELSVKEFLAERASLLDLEDAPDRLQRQATKLRRALAILNFIAAVVAMIAVIVLLITTFALADASGSHRSMATGIVVIAAWALSLAVLIVCIRAADIIRRRDWLTRGRQFDIEDSETFSLLFEPVLDGTFSVVELSQTGRGSAVTPNTKRPIDRYLTSRAFDDRALPAVLLARDAEQSTPRFRLFKPSGSDFVIIPPAARSAIDAAVRGDATGLDSVVPIAVSLGTEALFANSQPIASIGVDPSLAVKKVKKPRAKRENHWLSGMDEVDFIRLSNQIANRYASLQQQQVQTMLDVAYAEFNAKPDSTVSRVRDTVRKALEKAQLPVGFDHVDSVEWITRMLARSDDTHPYRYVRKFMPEPGYALPHGKPDEPELIFTGP